MGTNNWVRLSLLTALVASVFSGNQAMAGEGGCVTCGTPCGEVTYVDQKVMVPEWVTEHRKVTVTEYRMDQQERVRQVCVKEPYREECVRKVPVCVPEVHERMVNYTVVVPVRTQYEKKWTECVAVPKMVEKMCTVMVPKKVKKHGTKMVCETYQEEIMCAVTRDQGHWETRHVEVPVCHGCCYCPPTTCTMTCKVWVPNIVTEQVPRKVTRTRMVPKPYTYYVTVCEPRQEMRKVRTVEYKTVPRSKMVTLVKYKPDVRQKKVRYTKYRTEYREKKYMVTRYRTRMKDVKETVSVCVPVKVQKDVPVRVCKMVEKTVKVPVSSGCGSCAATCGMNYGCNTRCGGLFSRFAARHCGGCY